MELFQSIVRIYWPLFYSICLFLHSTMFILIYHRTSRLLTTLRFFLYPANTVNFVLATLAFATQVRNVNNFTSMALLCDGFCKFIGSWFCFHCYTFLLMLVTTSGLINLHTLCYRTMVLKYLNSRKSDRAIFKFSVHYLIPFICLILTYIPQRDHDFVFQETVATHPDYNLQIYRQFGGFSNSHHFCMTFNTLCLAATTIYVPIIGNYWKNIALKVLSSNISAVTSSHNRVMFETLIKGLSLQILLPLCCYVPITILYCWNKYSGTQILISQYTLSLLGTLPCIFDPCIQIYFIMPYRMTIKKFLSCQQLKPVVGDQESFFQLLKKFLGYSGGARRESTKVHVSMIL